MKRLYGKPADFSLDARIFHSICLVSIAALCYNIPLNFFIELPLLAYASIVMLVYVATLYYLSRFKNKVDLAILIFNITGIPLLIFNFYYNSGIDGPTDLFFLLFLLLSLAISPVSQYKIWLPVNIITAAALHFVQYSNLIPIKDTYPDQNTRVFDLTSAFVVIALMTFLCVRYIRNAYEFERNSALEKARSIEEKNNEISEQNRELERLNREKNKLFSIIGHDLRSPLAAIQNLLQLLAVYDLEEEERLSLQKDLLNSTNHTMTMLSKLLAWSKSQLHGISPSPEKLNLANLLTESLETEKGIANIKGINLQYEIPETLSIYADSEMMKIVVRNFIGNAIKFTPAGGQISVTAEEREGNCIISIEDNGIGIPAEKQQDLFSLTAESTYGTGGEKGVGLGLLLCAEYIKAQHGDVWFKSEPNAGSTFYISILSGDR